MTIEALKPVASIAARPLRPSTAIALAAFYSLALVSSAFLLFWIEPLFARMLLPRLGGTQSVWNTCLVFFQASLLLGYLYAHVLTRWLSHFAQMAVHLGVLCVGLAFLPIALNAAWSPPANGSPVLPVLAILAAALGWPFFALSANSSLLQHWFSRTGHPQAGNPYFLYVASNVGSLAALIAYPFFLEPNITLSHQSALWAALYIGLAVGIAATVAAGTLFAKPVRVETEAAQTGAAPITWQTRLAWIVYAAIPSSLLIGVTGYVTTDIASFPLIWLAPLAIYLLTFILTFASKPPIPHRFAVAALPVVIVIAAAAFWLTLFHLRELVLAFAAHFGTFFIIAMVCHGELARSRPGASRLTEFYFYVSLGGVIGGALTALVSPLVFSQIIEYPLVLACVCLLQPGPGAPGMVKARVRQILIFGAAIILIFGKPLGFLSEQALFYLCGFVSLMVIAWGFRPGHFRLRLAALGVLLFSTTVHEYMYHFGPIVLRERSFYGAYFVDQAKNNTYRNLSHGTTLHGVERIANEGRPVPLSYYTEGGPLGDVMRAVGPRSHSVAVIGLGIGSTACYARSDQAWTIYEIDPLVYRIAAKSGLFRSLPVCAPQAEVVFGDGRLSLEREPAQQHDLLVVDAFSSDAIPVHLMTREAFKTYLRALTPHGVLVVHITNRHFDLAPIIARLAPEAGFTGYVKTYDKKTAADPSVPVNSTWVALARDPADLGAIAEDAGWARLVADPKVKLWTDDFSDILSALK